MQVTLGTCNTSAMVHCLFVHLCSSPISVLGLAIFAGTHNQNIQVYDITTLKHVCSLSGHIGIVTVLRVTESAHGVYMFSGSSDTTVQVCVYIDGVGRGGGGGGGCNEGQKAPE